jgi:3-isopropylmalate dehydrogenase
MRQSLLLLPGDGIGPEVTDVSRQVIECLIEHESLDVALEERAFGGAAIEFSGAPIDKATIDAAQSATAVLVGAVGGPRWAKEPYDNRPEAGLLSLRQNMRVFANLRPAKCFDALVDASSLKREVVQGLNILFVRELVGGVYFGHPRGIEESNGSRRGVNTHVYTSEEIRRVARVAFHLARERSGTVCSVDKSNVMEAGLLWREEVQFLRDEEFQDVVLTHMLADNCAMQLVRKPRQFDIILTDNLFGDILSDAAAMLTGSLGMLPSAAIGAGSDPGLYEPIHGSAPDIAGQGIANPCASVLSLAMALRHSFLRPDLAFMVESAVSSALDTGSATRDIGGALSTQGMGAAIIASLDKK